MPLSIFENLTVFKLSLYCTLRQERREKQVLNFINKSKFLIFSALG